MPEFTPSAKVLLALIVIASAVTWVCRGRDRKALLNAFLLLSWGVVLVSTLTPSIYQMMDQQIRCSFDLTLGEVPRERLANVLLFIPLGCVTWFARARRAWLVGAVAAPFAIEALQGVVLALNRQCDVTDVVANLTGLVTGLALGALIGLASQAGSGGGRHNLDVSEHREGT